MWETIESKRFSEAINKVADSYSEKELLELLKDINLSEYVKNNTQKWKEHLNDLIEHDSTVREAVIYIVNNYLKKRKNNPEKFGRMHCIEAASLMAEHWFNDSDEVAAALLHDVREDIPNWEEYLKTTYNENIVNLVKALTEKDKSWDSLEKKKLSRKERKLEEMEKVSIFIPKELALKLADQISNIAETVNDLENMTLEDRQTYWEQFNAGYDKQIWKYETLSNIIETRIQECKEKNLFQNEYEELRLKEFSNKFKYLISKMKSLMESE